MRPQTQFKLANLSIVHKCVCVAEFISVPELVSFSISAIGGRLQFMQIGHLNVSGSHTQRLPLVTPPALARDLPPRGSHRPPRI